MVFFRFVFFSRVGAVLVLIVMTYRNTTAEPMEHWAFQLMDKPAVPITQNDWWGQTPIDRFVLAHLETYRVEVSQRAVRQTLLRRATFDLLGLPPTPQDVERYLKDSSPDAIMRVIDRLLASPHYGERWGRHWLDVARYADNKGYVFFEDKNYPWAYTYRDYVIRSMNEDVPYNQFIREQIAADQLDLGDDKRPLAAMGFLTLGGHFMNNAHDMIDDRIDVVTRGLMGLTVTCARCHDHKIDPIPQADYYSLYGVFRSCFEPTLHPLFEPPPKTDEYQKFAVEMAKREQALIEFVTTKHRELVTSTRKRVAEYLKVAHVRRGMPDTDEFMLLTEKGAINPAMVLRWQRYLENPKRIHNQVWGLWRDLGMMSADRFRQEISKFVKEGQAGERTVNEILLRELAVSLPTSMEELAEVYAGILDDVNLRWLAAVERANVAGLPIPRQLADPAAEQLRQTLYGSDAPADAPLELDWGFLSLFPDRPTQKEYQELLKAVEQWSSKADGAPPRAMVLYDNKTPFEPRIFQRGQPHRLGEFVPRQFLRAISTNRTPFRHGSGRRELAEAIVDPSNPLTSRVIVNRVWLHHFGAGLVTTPSDFGLQGDSPSHPKLLDFLAIEFVNQGWSLKKLHREIMTSSVYQQASIEREDGMMVDPENRLLWKMNHRRLDFESLRDSTLVVSNQLEHALYGPPVKFFYDHQDKPEKPTDQDKEGRRDGEIGQIGRLVSRRSVYGFIDRMNVSPLLTTFDFPNPNASSSQRFQTTVPPQSLYLMNSRFMFDAARRMLNRSDWEQSEIAGCILLVYNLLYARNPNSEEIDLGREFLGNQPDEETWVHYVHGLLLTNEFIFID